MITAYQDALVTVDVAGKSLLARATDVDVPHLIPADRRGDVSRTAGWIAPVVIWKGRVAGVWEVADGDVEVELVDEVGRVPAKALATAVGRVKQVRGT